MHPHQVHSTFEHARCMCTHTLHTSCACFVYLLHAVSPFMNNACAAGWRIIKTASTHESTCPFLFITLLLPVFKTNLISESYWCQILFWINCVIFVHLNSKIVYCFPQILSKYWVYAENWWFPISILLTISEIAPKLIQKSCAIGNLTHT